MSEIDANIIVEGQKAVATIPQDGEIIEDGGEIDATCIVEDSNGKRHKAVKIVNIDEELADKSEIDAQVSNNNNELIMVTEEQDGEIIPQENSEIDFHCLVQKDEGKQLSVKTVELDGEIIKTGGAIDATCLVQGSDGKRHKAVKVFNLGGTSDWKNKPTDWSDIRKDCPENSIALYAAHAIDFSSYDNLGFTATCIGGYKVFIDGTQYGSTYASGSKCSITWSTSDITTGDDIITPSTLKAHKIWISPATEGNNITAFHCARVAASGNERQGVLWAHFNIDNEINLGTAFATYISYYEPLMLSITAKNNTIKCNKLPQLGQSSDLAGYADNIEYLPIFDLNNNTINGAAGSFNLLTTAELEKVILKNGTITGSFNSFACNATKLKRINTKNVVLQPTLCQQAFQNNQSIEEIPDIDFTNATNLTNFITNAVALKDTVLDTRAGAGIVKIGCYGTSQYFMSGFKGLRVSNEAPFNNATPPQINVSYTGMDRSALVQLFNDLPTVSDGQIINITGCSGSSSLIDSEIEIATNKGWTVTGGPAFQVYSTYNASVGDTIKLNDGMATSDMMWSAYPSDTSITGDYTQTATVTAVEENNVIECAKPTQDNKTASVASGEIYYGWTDGTNTYYTTTENISNDSHLYDSNFNDITSQHTIEANTFVQPVLAASGTMGGDSFAVSAQYTNPFYDWYPFASDANTDLYKTWAKSGNTGDYIMYNPDAIKVISFEITNRNDNTGVRPIVSGTVYGSNDGTNYTELTTFENSNTTINSTWTLTVNSSAKYKYYKISGVSNNTGYIGIGKIKINATSEILIDGNLVTSTSSIVKDITSDIEIIDNTTIQTVTITSDQTTEIETSTDVTTDNNGVVITDGSRHNFNITVPSSFVSIMQSGGQQYNVTYCPYTFKANTGVGLLLKNGDNVYYRNTWIITRDYDLHYQQINFSYPSGATVTCKVNNVLQNDLTPYCYAGDTITWTCDNAGTVTTGSYTVKYSSKDGNIQTITIS